jgi:hypothetical protein
MRSVDSVLFNDRWFFLFGGLTFGLLILIAFHEKHYSQFYEHFMLDTAHVCSMFDIHEISRVGNTSEYEQCPT